MTPPAVPAAAGMLDGIRVADFGRYVAGPWCAQLLQGPGRFAQQAGEEEPALAQEDGLGMEEGGTA